MLIYKMMCLNRLREYKRYDTYHYFKEYQKELLTVCSNVDSILGHPHIPETDRSQDHAIS